MRYSAIAATLAALATLALTTPPPARSAGTEVAVRRVPISASFTGQEVFVYGEVPAGTETVVSIMEAPTTGPVRLMLKGRRAFFWLGVRQYAVDGAPGLYLAHVSCPICNGLAECPHKLDIEALNRALAPQGVELGLAEIAAHSKVECRSGKLEPGEADRVLDGFWALQGKRGLYRLIPNSIRISAAHDFYESFALPTQAPEGRYTIRTFFLADGKVIGATSNELFVSKTGLIAWLSRLAERRAGVYAIITVLIAVAAGWLAGMIFKRGGGH